MSELTSPSFSPSDCETVSTAPSRSVSPEPSENENMFMSAAMMPQANGKSPFCFRYAQPSRSTEFWFEDGSAVIEVENTMYNVHTSVLKRQSSFFREVLHTPGSSSTLVAPEVSAGSHQRPLVLDVAKLYFELLLSLIYPSDFWSRYNFTAEEWFGIANIATRLEFPSIRKLALESVFERCSALELIDLGGTHELPECISSGFRMLCFAEEPLSLKDGQRIGMEMVIQVARARELLAKGSKWSELESQFVF